VSVLTLQDIRTVGQSERTSVVRETNTFSGCERLERKRGKRVTVGCFNVIILETPLIDSISPTKNLLPSPSLNRGAGDAWLFSINLTNIVELSQSAGI